MINSSNAPKSERAIERRRLWDFYRSYCRYYDINSDAWTQKLGEGRIQALLSITKKGLFLDVGCGAGTLVVKVAERGTTAIGIELSTDACELAKALGLASSLEALWTVHLYYRAQG